MKKILLRKQSVFELLAITLFEYLVIFLLFQKIWSGKMRMPVSRDKPESLRVKCERCLHSDHEACEGGIGGTRAEGINIRAAL